MERVWVTEDLECYRPIFDPEWAKLILEKTEKTEFEPIAFELVYGWRSVSSLLTKPLALVQAVTAALGSHANFDPAIYTMALDVKKFLYDELKQHLSKSQRRMLKKRVNRICDRAIEGKRSAIEASKVDEIQVWKQLYESGHFITIPAEMRMCYSHLVAYYERFIIGGLEVINGKPTTTYEKPFRKSLCEAFGEPQGTEFYETYWNSAVLRRIKLIRNIIMHNGTRLSSKTRKEFERLCCQYLLIDETVQIKPEDVRNLHAELKKRIEGILDMFTRTGRKTT